VVGVVTVGTAALVRAEVDVGVTSTEGVDRATVVEGSDVVA
jgi:hypothetical protein